MQRCTAKFKTFGLYCHHSAVVNVPTLTQPMPLKLEYPEGIFTALKAAHAMDMTGIYPEHHWGDLLQVVSPGYVRVVKGEGMPKSKAPGQKGDLRIAFEIQFPKEQLKGVEATQMHALLDDKM